MSTIQDRAREVFGGLEDESGATPGAGAAPLVKLGPGGDFTRNIEAEEPEEPDDNAEARERGIRRAEKMLDEHYGPDDTETMLTDALADLMHWADLYGVKFDNQLRIARDHHEEEKAS